MSNTELKEVWRKSSQFLMPASKAPADEGIYDIYPAHQLEAGLIHEGFGTLAARISGHSTVLIDGEGGVFYGHFMSELDKSLKELGLKVSWIMTADYMLTPPEIDSLIEPYLGGDDPLFGKRAGLELSRFFRIDELRSLKPDSAADISIIIGPGAALAGWSGLLIYTDIPKNEIQFRSRAGSVTNLGAAEAADPKRMYKRYYFVDWPVLARHKEKIIGSADLFVDAQRPGNPVWMPGEELRKAIGSMSRNVFRVRPWFEPGVWGGSWIKDHIPALSQDVPNYAWSFELIVPENGLLFESGGKLLEASFDTLMYLEASSVLGDCHQRFGTSFPIRFDFLDTFDGGNLSIQCHPAPEYTKQHFGEDFTQEETYYILDTKEDAAVYLGFTGDIDPGSFREELERSFREGAPAEIERYVQKHKAARHDLFLIPYGTVHGSGINNLVLEISSTPYIFTFKMYDWVRPDLDGRPRSLNIGRAMENLDFSRKGSYVTEKLISKPRLLGSGEGWKLYHLPTHEKHLYDVHRYHFHGEIEIETGNKCHVLSLVQGSSVEVSTAGGMKRNFSYAETFVVPAAAGSYRIRNLSGSEAMLVKAFVK